MFTKLYLDTTNPKLCFSQMFQSSILFPMIVSVLIHTIIYILFCNMVSYIFYNRFLSNQINKRLFLCLIPIMFLGFIARFFHVKDIYRAYHGDMVKTRNHLDKLYISWIFIS
jgi:uncharacterized protein YqhQ